jgi:glycosyltransferase involved in cell wall biosynthesis
MAATVRGEHAIGATGVGSAHILEGVRVTAALRGLYNIKARRVLSDWIAANDTPGTIYHLHGWSKVLSPSIFRALQQVLCRLVVHAHDFFIVCPNGGYFDFRRERICELTPLSASCLACNCDRRRYSHKLWRSARQGLRRTLFDAGKVGLVLAVHDGMLPLLTRGGLPEDRLRVLRNPVTPWRNERVPAERNRVFLFVGRLDEDKGPYLLGQAARQARVPLRMIGAGPLAGALARDFPEVEFVGWKSREEIAQLCLDTRALIMPTRSRETFGLAAMEAVTSGLPVVLSDHAMMADEIAVNGYGFSCTPQDVDGLAVLLRRLADDSPLVAAMSRKAFDEARRLAPTPQQWADQLLTSYAPLLPNVNTDLGK